MTHAVRSEQLSENALSVHTRLQKALRNLGYNPNVVAYPLSTCPTPNPADITCQPDPPPRRIGIVLPEVNRLLFTSDDNILVDPSSGAQSGTLQASESYGFWLASDKINLNAPLDLTPKLDLTAAEPCTPAAGQSFDTPYFLVGLVKGAALTDPSTPAIFAENIGCFEVRYFSEGRSYFTQNTTPPLNGCNMTSGVCGAEEVWERIWPASVASPPACSLQFRAGAPFGTQADEQAFYECVRDGVRKLQIGVTVMGAVDQITGKGTKTEKFVFDVKFANSPWLQSLITGHLPGRT